MLLPLASERGGGASIAGLADCRVKKVTPAGPGEGDFPNLRMAKTFPGKQPKRPLFKQGSSLNGGQDS